MQTATDARPYKIGTRGSALALAQAHETRARLCATHNMRQEQFEIIVVSTSGDRIQDRPLSEVGGKGLFSKEIEDLLLEGAIDLAVHSSKDMATTLPDGLVLAAFLPREDARDAFIGREVKRLIELPHGATIGSSSLRRQAQIKHLRPDLNVVMFRGNVQTRLRKLSEGQVDGTLLALAGLKRLGLAHVVTEILSETEFLPAPGQGAICIEIRDNDSVLQALVRPISHEPTMQSLTCERAFLKVLDGDCRTPLAGHASIVGDKLHFKGLILSPDGTVVHAIEDSGSSNDATQIGERAARNILEKAGKDFFASWA